MFEPMLQQVNALTADPPRDCAAPVQEGKPGAAAKRRKKGCQRQCRGIQPSLDVQRTHQVVGGPAAPSDERTLARAQAGPAKDQAQVARGVEDRDGPKHPAGVMQHGASPQRPAVPADVGVSLPLCASSKQRI